MSEWHKFAGPKERCGEKQFRTYLRNPEVCDFVTEKAKDAARDQGRSVPDIFTDILMNALLPSDQLTAECVFRLYTGNGTGLKNALDKMIRLAVNGPKTRRKNPATHDLVRHIHGFLSAPDSSWPKTWGERCDAWMDWGRFTNRLENLASWAFIDRRLALGDALERARQFERALGPEGAGDVAPGAYSELILEVWPEMRTEPSVYEFLAAALCHSSVTVPADPESRRAAAETYECISREWDSGEEEPNPPDEMQFIHVGKYDWARVPKEARMLNPADERRATDAALVRLGDAQRQGDLFVLMLVPVPGEPSPSADDAALKRALARMLEGRGIKHSLDNAIFCKIPDAEEYPAEFPYGAAIYRAASGKLYGSCE